MKRGKMLKTTSKNVTDADGCDLEIEPLAEAEEDLFVIFAEALDPKTKVTVEQVAFKWENKL